MFTCLNIFPVLHFSVLHYQITKMKIADNIASIMNELDFFLALVTF